MDAKLGQLIHFTKNHANFDTRSNRVDFCIERSFSLFCGSDEIEVRKEDVVSFRSEGLIKITFLSKNPPPANAGFLKGIGHAMSSPTAQMPLSAVTRAKGEKEDIRF